jgi:hypothetical protein
MFEEKELLERERERERAGKRESERERERERERGERVTRERSLIIQPLLAH